LHRRFAIRANMTAVTELAAQLRAACADFGLDEDAAGDLELAVVEAAMNIVVHGYGGSDCGTLEVCVRSNDGAVQVELTDAGAPIPPGALESAELGDVHDDVSAIPTSGRGLALIKASVDAWRYLPAVGHNRLILIKRG
jgi:serine/threonine-protein kinase RsbW